MHFPRSEMRIDPRKKRKQAKTTQNQKPTEKGPEPNATNTSLPPIAVMGAANAHTTARNIYQQKLDSQGRPQHCLQKSYQFQVPKTNPKLAPCTCLSWSLQSFLFCYVDERGPVFHSLQSWRFEARRGLAEATPRTQNVLAQGQARLTGAWNCVILLLKSQQDRSQNN